MSSLCETFDTSHPARPFGEPLAADGMVAASAPTGDAHFPLIVEPAMRNLDPADWASSHRELIESALRRYGALLFRGFSLGSAAMFEGFAEAMSQGLYGQYGDLPKKESGRNIYRSTPYPEREMILFHNESSHLGTWPCRQWFYCELASRTGGCTPLVDVRQMAGRLPSPLAESFARKGLLYVRTFNEDLDVSWRDFFKTDDRAQVEAMCQDAGSEATWLDNETLQTRTHCHALMAHPVTGERVFFNQVQLHHPHSLAPAIRRDLLDLVGADRFPRNVFFGDGSLIPDEDMALIGDLYEACAIRFPWQKDDVVLLDNMLVAHARDPYEGPRRIAVAMGHMMSRKELPPIGSESA